MLWLACEVKPVSEATGTVALQSSWFGKCCVGRALGGLLVQGVHCAGTEANMTEKGSSSREQGVGDRTFCKQVR